MKIPRYCTTPLFYKTEMLILMLMLIKSVSKIYNVQLFMKKEMGLRETPYLVKLNIVVLG